MYKLLWECIGTIPYFVTLDRPSLLLILSRTAFQIVALDLEISCSRFDHMHFAPARFDMRKQNTAYCRVERRFSEPLILLLPTQDSFCKTATSARHLETLHDLCSSCIA